jgi:aryl-alcohol dehydrogenase-like predicted oxidoreductase
MERGLNYLDMAPAYGRGECEESYGKIIDNSAKREKVFMTTKSKRIYQSKRQVVPGNF